MEENNIEYKELFERSGFDTLEQVKYKINAVIEAHPQESGWEVGEPEITKDMNGKYKVSIPLTKYQVTRKHSR